MTKKKKRNRKTKKLKKMLQFELAGIALIAISFIAIIKLGPVGIWTTNIFYFFLGEWYIVGLLAMLWIAGFFIIKREWPLFFTSRLIGLYLVLTSMLLLSHIKLFGLISEKGKLANSSVIKNTFSLFKQIIAGESSTNDFGGGMIGAVLFSVFHLLFDTGGTKLMSFFLIIVGVILITGKSLGEVFEKVGSKIIAFIKSQWQGFLKDMNDWRAERKARKEAKKSLNVENKENNEQNGSVLSQEDEVKVVEMEQTTEPIISSFSDEDTTVAKSNRDVPEEEQVEDDQQEDDISSLTFIEEENKDYTLPPFSLLKRPRSTDQSGEYKLVHANAAKLERTFQSFGVKARVTQVHFGPAVTKYEVHPDVGVKVSRIVSFTTT